MSSVGGRGQGNNNYTTEEYCHFIQLALTHPPVGGSDWQLLAEEHSKHETYRDQFMQMFLMAVGAGVSSFRNMNYNNNNNNANDNNNDNTNNQFDANNNNNNNNNKSH
jgi:hypothetical protein